MKVIDINGKERNVVGGSLRKIVHPVPDKINGGFVDTDFIEMEIQGRFRTWQEWCSLDIFKKNNPEINYE
ncbi:MAG: hypothetical protein Q8O88_01450 [bacterium]|nr:hypothetical protein [bacterium]